MSHTNSLKNIANDIECVHEPGVVGIHHETKVNLRPFASDVARLSDEGGHDPLRGDVTWRTLISADHTPSGELVLGIAQFQPGGVLYAHRHEPAEFYLGLSGTGEVTIDGRVFHVASGISIFIPGNAEHGVIAGSEGLSIAYGFARDTFGEIGYSFSSLSTPKHLGHGTDE